MTGEPGEEHRRSHGQERPHRHHANRCPDGEVHTSNEMAVEAISDQEVEDDDIEQAREQARRVGVATKSPIHVNRQSVGDESGHKEERHNDPVAAEAVKEQVADGDRSKKRSVEPEEHPHPIRRPEVVYDPFHKPAVKKRFIEDVNDK